jgi:holo-[acyl-carrier protein] synthase
MILPVSLPPRHLRASGPPQGLVLDSPYAPASRTELSPGTSTDRYAEYHKEAVVETAEIGTNAVVSADGCDHTDIAELPDGQLCEISISHDGDLATAVALVPYMKMKI